MESDLNERAFPVIDNPVDAKVEGIVTVFINVLVRETECEMLVQANDEELFVIGAPIAPRGVLDDSGVRESLEQVILIDTILKSKEFLGDVLGEMPQIQALWSGRSGSDGRGNHR